MDPWVLFAFGVLCGAVLIELGRAVWELFHDDGTTR